ncbi:hypothetical protein Tco_1544544, partial [Tanacetum coccineum]
MGVLPQLREDGLLENKPMTILEIRLGKGDVVNEVVPRGQGKLKEGGVDTSSSR